MKFTFILSVHNAMPHIQACVQSILAQSYPNFNVVILENKSTDGTAEYLHTLTTSPKVHIVYSQKLLSIEDTWKQIHTLQKNEYMVVANAKAIYHKDFLLRLKDLINNNSDSSVYCANIVSNGDNKPTGLKEKNSIYDYLKARLRGRAPANMASFVIKTQSYHNLNEVGGMFYSFDQLVMKLIGTSYLPLEPQVLVQQSCISQKEYLSEHDEIFKSFKKFCQWMISTGDSRLISIVKDYLPFHLHTMQAVLTPLLLKEYQSLYSCFNIDPHRVKDIHICFASDKNYLPFMATAMLSALLSSDPDERLHFYVLCNNMSDQDKKNVSFIKKYKKCEIHFIDLDENAFSQFPAVGAHITNTSYYRYKIPELLENLTKVIWLDCDVIVKDSLWDLYQTDITNFPIAAVEDVGYTYWRTRNSKLIYQGFYINAGVLLINAALWRKEKAGDALMEYTLLHKDEISIGDQDVINAVFKDRIKSLDYKWNVQDSFLRAAPERAFNNHEKDILLASLSPAVIHYTTANKPWNNYKCPLAKEWFYYNAFLPSVYRKNLWLRKMFNHKFWRRLGIKLK